MTQHEQDKLRQHLGEADNYIREELFCREMIDSIICYGGFGKTAIEILNEQKNSWHNYLASYIKELGEQRVLELIQEQINDIAGVDENVYTDCEGVTYNSIIWAR